MAWLTPPHVLPTRDSKSRGGVLSQEDKGMKATLQGLGRMKKLGSVKGGVCFVGSKAACVCSLLNPQNLARQNGADSRNTCGMN